MASLAERLSKARLEGGTVTLGDGELADDMAAAQAIQDEIWTLMGDRCGGWKIGGTSTESQQRLGTSAPGAARLPAKTIFPNYANLPVHPEHTPAIEAEFAFRLSRDLPPRDKDYSDDEVAAAVNGVAPAIEIAGTRFKGTLKEVLNRNTLTADGGFGMALVAGTFRSNWQDYPLGNHTMRVTINGEPAGEGTGARVMGNPFKALVWLANAQRTKAGLKAGEIVSSGSCTQIFPVQVGDSIYADFGRLGVVAVTIFKA
jgi:2-keto-4-pentenoate hydratase